MYLLIIIKKNEKKNLDIVVSSLMPGECSGAGTVQRGSRAKTLFNNLQRPGSLGWTSQFEQNLTDAILDCQRPRL